MGDRGQLLLVEDDRELREAVALALGARGWEVASAGSFRAAHRALDRRGADVVVVDLGLPDRSGPGLVEALRDAAPGARLVVFTGRDQAEVRRACLDAGADDYVIKPVSGGELADLLDGD